MMKKMKAGKMNEKTVVKTLLVTYDEMVERITKALREMPREEVLGFVIKELVIFQSSFHFAYGTWVDTSKEWKEEELRKILEKKR